MCEREGMREGERESMGRERGIESERVWGGREEERAREYEGGREEEREREREYEGGREEERAR